MPLRTIFSAIALLLLAYPAMAFDASSTTGGFAVNSTVDSAFPASLGSIETGLPAVEQFQHLPTTVTSPSEILGCGAVGQGEYTSGLFNMPEVFGKFQTDVNSVLAKEMLTLNYSMPQTAALFDTLNSYGNQRYDQFQRSCSINSLQKDARQNYLNQCIAQQVPLRQAIIQQQASASGGSEGSTAMSAEVLQAQSYAQAWEICSMQYVSDTNAYQTFQQANKDFGKKLRQTENVTQSISGLICMGQNATEDTGNANATEETCWPMLMLTQVRLCNMDSATDCTGDYGVKPPLLSMQQYFNMLRYTVEKGITVSVTLPIYRSLVGIPDVLVESSANLTVNNMNGNPPAAQTVSSNVKEITKNFQYNYLNCTNPNILYPMQQFVANLNTALNRASAGATDSVSVTMPTFDENAYKGIVDNWQGLFTGNSQDTELAQLNMTVLGCTANQLIPMFDPNIVTVTHEKCSLDKDIPAFYTLSSYDLAYESTKRVYGYLKQRLQQVYGQLEHDSLVPGTSDNQSHGTASSDNNSNFTYATINSPALNKRMADVIKNIMLPEIDRQLKQLDQFNKAKGEFSQRLQLIFAQKQGCVYGQAGAQTKAGGIPDAW